MKRAVFAAVLLAAVLAVAYVYAISRRDANYSELLLVGDAAAARGDLVAAIEAFSGAIALKPDFMVGYLKRGEAYWRREALETAARDLRRATELDPLAPRPREFLGDVTFALERYESAAERYREYVELDDSSHRVFYKLALAHYRAAQPTACVEALQRAVTLEKHSAETYYLRGLCLRDAQRPKEAIAALERAVAISPVMLESREELAQAYASLGRSDDRIAQLEALLALDPGASRDIALGLAHAESGDSTSAVQVLSRAVRRYPNYRYTYVALGRVWLDLAEARDDRIALHKAIEALQHLTGGEPNAEALMLSGRALLLAGDVENAEHALRQSTEQLPVEAAAFAYLAQAAERLNHLEIARQALIDYDSLTPDSSDSRRATRIASRIADLSMKLKDPAAAVTWYQRAASITTPGAALLVRMAEAQAAAGDVEAAVVTADRALALDPHHAGARALKRKFSRSPASALRAPTSG